MLRPEQMSKLSVTGSKSVMDDVIEAMYEMHLVHITDYDGSWEGFEPGSSLEGADEVSSQLVTVRALESILDVDADEVGNAGTVDLDDWEADLEELRTEVNDLDDQRDELQNRLRDIEEQLDRMELFADLGIDLDLLWGYETLDVLVGEGDAEEVDAALAEADEVEAYEVFGGTDSVAAFARMTAGEQLGDALVGVSVAAVEVPEERGDPAATVSDLENEKQQVEAELEKLENELEALKHESATFLLALEEYLTIDAEKSEAPLRFATTERSFIAEGWVPTDRFDEVEDELTERVGEHIEISELQRAAYTSGGHLGHGDEHDAADHAGDAEAATDGGEEAVADGGTVATDGGTDGVVTVPDDPPVIQRNSKLVSPFEVLVKAVNRPKYSELDPTVLVFLTFPFFFGFMIGDVGYGLLYVLIGYWVSRKFESGGVRDFGMVVVWLGLFTAIFGLLYGEIFGLHFLEWFGIHPPIEKGLTATDWAITWLIAAVIFGWVQLNIAYIVDFYEEFQLHGIKPALIESGSWFLMLNGIWVWIFSHHLAANKPSFLFGSEAAVTAALGIPFPGFPAEVGIIGIAMFALGLALILSGPWYEAFEFLVPMVHVLSYTRLTAVLLSKAGMAVAANLLYFGAYQDEEGFHYMHHYSVPEQVEAGKSIVFPGLFNMGGQTTIGHVTLGLEGAIIGIPVLLAAHAVVLAIGGTAALQAIRLEYVEFFGKFYEGGGRTYQPFGYERTYTADN